MAVEVIDLSTGKKQVFTCLPKEAVVAAYAQSRGDFNTWDYDKYSVCFTTVKGRRSVTCGDFSAWIVS